MQTWFELNKHKRFCVLGLGLSGMSCVRFLVEQGIEPSVCDTRSLPPGIDELKQLLPQVDLTLGQPSVEYLQQFDFVLMSPGIDPRADIYQTVLANGTELINEIELFAHGIALTDKQVVAVTGSNGKSTVVSLLGEALNKAEITTSVGGNIGRPALDCLSDSSDIIVLELSSFQLEFCPSFAADIALVLNVSEDHMDRYADLAHYAQTKRAIYQNARLAIFNHDDQQTYPEQHPNAISFGVDCQADWQVEQGHACLQGNAVCSLQQSRLVGLHNQQNMLAVTAVAYALNADPRLIEIAFNEFSGLQHRCEKVSEKLGVTWVNDSKATNVGATLAALSGLANIEGQLVLIAGGVGKDADFSPLQSVLNSNVDHLITLGRDGQQIAALKANAQHVSSIQDAVKLAAKITQVGDTVLLSPACASLDMFKNFEQRGLAFVAAVEALNEQ
ncbi:UDP-N-acetylmuramoyl-L-alanine--D-glutamate ligase [Saccharobesus litoralis]|uniref:UDP-N-acetylmuramoylalanine--D-glutamate ligase n=1 Tax=Saccharobesus litoralis TaxID=2172099 RepID=A0A2S0VX38_9ALTE|nr:UDP-N-acetylmuramoyl-L-alanine--D-glutamate ligase [Saccharobesus litoralis]AWB68742.1 UDP-N-acetylmuramoyl-L-alanine--D-glutamate ligase [Saccharobesus litoralis]